MPDTDMLTPSEISFPEQEQLLFKHDPLDPIRSKLPWFPTDNVREIFIGEKKFRQRYYDKDLIQTICEYHAFYPENYYNLWEMMQEYDLLQTHDSKTVLDISPNTRMGGLESILRMRETNALHYRDDEYTHLRTDELSDMSKRILAVYNFESMPIEESNDWEHEEFQFVHVDDANVWPDMEGKVTLAEHGVLMLRFPNIISEQDHAILENLVNQFEEVQLVKPQISHIWNPETYVLCTNYMPNEHQLQIQNIEYFQQKICRAQNQFFRQEPDQLEASLAWAEKYKIRVKEYYVLDDVGKTAKELINLHSQFKQYELKPQKTGLNRNQVLDMMLTHDYLESEEYLIEELQDIKRELNNCKRIIDTKPQEIRNDHKQEIYDWNKLTNDIDLYKKLKYLVGEKYNAELSTNAWTKIYEQICHLNMIPGMREQFKSFHICEAPGAFVASVNHYVQTKTRVRNFDWYAQSLNPYNTENQQRFAGLLGDDLGLMKRHPNRWIFGANEKPISGNERLAMEELSKRGTGDITDSNVIKAYRKDPRLQGLDLITSDCGLRIVENMFNEQEIYLSRVNYGQFLCLLHVLPRRKSCIFKTFAPLSESCTVSMLFLLYHVFDKIILTKPVTSHPSSSEIYVICRGYKGIDDKYFAHMFHALENFKSDKCLFNKEDLAPEFLELLIGASRFFCQHQLQSIRRSLFFHDNYYTSYDALGRPRNKPFEYQKEVEELREQLPQNWMRKYRLKNIFDNRKLCRRPKQNIKYTPRRTFHTGQQKHYINK